MAPCTCRPPPASSPIRFPRANGARRRTRRGRCSPRPSRCTRAWTRRWKDVEMLLMIDNYDSFTYNLVQYFGELGQEVKVVRNDEMTVDEVAALGAERIVLSPGPCSPNEAGVCLELLDRLKGRVPILGVCLGHQAIG